MASAASGPKLLGSVPHCRTKSWLTFEVQAILAELALANSSIGFSTCVPVWLVVGVPGVWAKPKPAQNTRTAAIFKRFFIPFSPPEKYYDSGLLHAKQREDERLSQGIGCRA